MRKIALTEPGPVSAAFDLTAIASQVTRQRIHRAIAVVDSVHTDGGLPRIPIDHVVDMDARAQYRAQANRGRALGIGIDPLEPRVELALVHEIGHFLDHQSLGNRGGYASERHPRLRQWRHAVVATEAIRQLRALDRTSNENLSILLRRAVHPDDRALITRLLRYTEIWARSYVQYIAARSGDPVVQRQFADEGAAADRIEIPGFWDNDDFLPVHSAIDDLFRQKEWINGRDKAD